MCSSGKITRLVQLAGVVENTVSFWKFILEFLVKWNEPLMVSALIAPMVHSTLEGAVWVRALAGDIVLCSWARSFTLTVRV